MRSFPAIYLIIIFLLVPNLFSQTPHLVGDKIYNSDGSVPGIEEIEFTAHIKSRPLEILNSDDSGVTGLYYNPNPPTSLTWLVQVGDFPTAWSIGEILCVQFTHLNTGETKTIEIALDDNPVQSYGDLSLPVSLSIFRAFSSKGEIHIEWHTESEVDLLGFVLERKSDKQSNYEEIASYLTHPSMRCQENSNYKKRYRYIDKNVFMGTSYFYLLTCVSLDGHRQQFGPISATASSQNVTMRDGMIPTRYDLSQNYPNPFNPITHIEFSIPPSNRIMKTKLVILNTLGQEIKTLVNGYLSPGNYIVWWDGSNKNNMRVSSGTYFYYLRNEEIFLIKKMLYLK
ncbi:MAG: hypothetical protein Kow0042_14020 [Calditrichia bacterium]